MNIPFDVYFFGVCAGIPAILLLLAGAGFRHTSTGLVAVLAISIGGALVGGVAGFVYGMATRSGGGMFSGLEALFWMVVIAGIAFVICLMGSLIVFSLSGRLALDRAPISVPYLVIGFGILPVLAVYSVVQIIDASPSFQSNSQLAQTFSLRPYEEQWRQELNRRGAAARPAIIAELKSIPQDVFSDKWDGVVPLLNVLWDLGGPESLAEIKRWTTVTVNSRVRVPTIGLLASHGDKSVLPLAVEILNNTSDANWETCRTELFNVLGTLKAREYVGVIRTALIGDAAQKNDPAYEVVLAGVKALTDIDTDEAWAVIGELICIKKVPFRMSAVNMLVECKSPRVIPLLAKSLDDPDAAIREDAYGALLRYDPTLLEPDTSTEWNEPNLARMREAVKKRASGKP